MKKILLSTMVLGSLLATAAEAQAQANLVHGISAGIGLARMAGRNKAAQPEASTSTYRGQKFPMQRTPAELLPKKGAEQVTAVETQLDRFHAALLADSTSALCTAEQRTDFQKAIVSLARAQSSWSLQNYQQEATFYLAEDARRKSASASAK